MKFKLDENLPIEAAELLRQKLHDAMTVVEQQLAGHPDPEIAEVCREEGRALITLDLDFSNIRTYPPRSYSGIVVLRPTIQSIPMIQRLLQQVIALLEKEPIVGRLWIVDETQVRIRTG